MVRFLVIALFITLSYALPKHPSDEEILLTALTYLGKSYQFGSKSLYAMDCSAFVQRVFELNGIKLPRTAREQATYGVKVSRDRLKPGDLLFFTTYAKGPSHVGIYIGDGKMIHASSKKGITIARIDEPYWKKRFLFAKRILPDRRDEEDEIRDIIVENLRD